MKISTLLATLTTLSPIAGVWAGQPLDLQVNFRGQIHDISGVSTLSELQAEIATLTDLEQSKQGILFQGKNLLSATVGDSELEDLGLTNGSVLNVVPKKKKKTSSSAAAAGAIGKSSSGATTTSSAADAAKANLPPGLGEEMEKMEEMLRSQGIDPEELKKMMPGDGEMPDPAEAMKMMQDMMKSPMFDTFMNDEARLEESRQQILKNPMMAQAMQGIPGFSEILNSKELWRDTMRAAAQMYKNMGPEDLAAMMQGGMGGMPGMNMPGMGGMNMDDMFGSSSSVNSALDELSEGDD
mmetsp:Transcript_28536/g.44383  ORF Transcript_28536/g.44383 Transcript_28536/m.44383 type:complete len:296 (+) Transcript_28536:64-951(+)|eukprot:CAMPEP_0196811450 /NCGR_PEP_ID=MMETSP1362-20130617/17622_1 /TAXON_ID=163516 /ORGANISM="Leptocylindrus danicus, Strain CCMP1856" /LENGTH=295 /DNA_ID=CAMNT_0042186747 /DNA_START=64 /DNA_END=951 /DNA_ORIENTATION=+